jgi:hypothetical protein
MPQFQVTITQTYTVEAGDEAEARDLGAMALGEDVAVCFEQNETTQADDFDSVVAVRV